MREYKTVNCKHRYRFMNWIRVLAFVLIIVYHFIVELEKNSIYSFVNNGIYYSNVNIDISVIGVSLFFIISGSGLMLSSQRKWDIKKYYFKRFVRVLIPFYIVYIFAFIASFAIKQEWINSFSNVPIYNFIFTLFGADNYFGQFFQTFGIHIGEWFLGALIILYVLFPLFRVCMEKNRYITIIVSTIYYVVINVTDIISITPWMSVFVKAYDFVLGMFVILEIPKINDKKPLKIIFATLSLVIIALGIILNVELPLPIAVKNLLYAVAIYVFLFTLEDVGKSVGIFDKIINGICSISYELFLVHHIIIYYIGDNLVGEVLGAKRIIALFITEVIIMVAFAFFVKKAEGLIMTIAKKIKEKGLS